MSYKVRFVAALVIIIIVSWFDYHYLSQYPDSFPVENIRRVLHLLLLTIVMLAGGFVWAKSPLAWTRIIWWYSYLFALVFLLVIGLIAHFVHIFSYPVLYSFYEFRIFFCSPLPLFILLIFSGYGRRANNGK